MTLKTTEPVHPSAALAAALAAAQAELQDPERTKRGQVRGRNDYRYAGLDDLLRSVRPVLARHSIALTHRVEQGEADDRLVAELRHAGGGVLASSWRLTCKGTPQDRGSELTYARRYTLEGLVGVAPTEEDDDGAAASRSVPQREDPPAPKVETPKASAKKPESKPAAQSTTQPDPLAVKVEPAHSSWPEFEGAFRAKVHKLGLDFALVVELAQTRPTGATPQQMGQIRRSRYLDWLGTEEGQAAYNAYSVTGIEALLSAVADMHVLLGENLLVLSECGQGAGLPITDDGPVVDGAPEPMLRRYLHNLRQRAQVQA